jgi:hypothetical protein
MELDRFEVLHEGFRFARELRVGPLGEAWDVDEDEVFSRAVVLQEISSSIANRR